MTTPDVRIRLSAEGVAEVVSALKKVQAEGNKTGQAGSKSFLGLNSVLGSTANLLGGLGIALGVGSFIGFIKQASEAADQVGKVSQRLGASVENLSALNLAAATADVSTEQLSIGLIRMNKQLALLAEGSPDAQATFRNLGLAAKDFKGKDAVQAFDLISGRMAKVGDGARKTKSALDIFGKAGAQLIPLMNDLAEEGLGNLIERARELGVLLSGEMVAATQKMNDDFQLLKLQSQALGIQFATGLAPSVSQSLSIVSGGLAQSKDAWRDFGQAVGGILKFIVAMVADAFDITATLLAQVAIALVSTGRAMSAVIRGDFKRALAEMKAGGDASEAEMAALRTRIAERDRLATTAGDPAKPRAGAPETEEDPAALAQRNAAALRSVADAELTLTKARLKARLDAEKRSYDEGLISARDYFAARRQLVKQEADAEVASLQARKALLADEPDQIKAVADAKVIDAQINKIRLDQESQLLGLTADEKKAVEDLGEKRLGFVKKIFDAQGRTHAVAMQEIGEEVASYHAALRQAGVPPEARARLTDAYRAALTAAADLGEAQKQAEAAMANLSLDRQAIENQVASGQLTQLQGEQALLALEQDRLVALRALAAAYLASAEATNNDEKIRQAQEFAASVDAIGAAGARAANQMTVLRDGIEQSGIQALTDFFARGITEAESFGEAVKDMARSVIQSIRQIVSEMMAAQIVKGLSGLFGGLGGGGGGGGGGTEYVDPGAYAAAGGRIGSLPRFSMGGVLRGPGTGTSDSLAAVTEAGRPVRLSNGEFVVRAASVQQPGALEFLHAFNQWGTAAIKPISPSVQRFAGGGLVAQGGTAGGQQQKGGSLLIGLDEGLVLKAFSTPAGQRVLVESVSRNRRALQQVLNG